jgi:O-antigen ligase
MRMPSIWTRGGNGVASVSWRGNVTTTPAVRVFILVFVVALVASSAAMTLGSWSIALLGLPVVATAAPLLAAHVRRFASRWTRNESAWVLLLGATLSVDTLTTTQVFVGALGAAQLARLGLVTAALLMVAPALKRIYLASLAPVVRTYVSFVAFAALSILWSAGRLATAGKVLEIGVATAIMLAVVTEGDGKRHLERLFQITLVCIGFLLAVIAVGYSSGTPAFSSYVMLADRYIMSGGPIALSSNAIARLGAVGAVACVAIALRPALRPTQRMLALGWTIYFGLFPFLAVGRTGIASLIVGLATLLLLRWPVRAGVLVLTAAAVAGPIYVGVGQEYFLRGQTTELFLGLSGRVYWWESALDVVRQAPLTGFGYGVGGRVAFSAIENDVTSGLHNGVLETFAGVGLLGLAVWMAAVVQVIAASARQLLLGQDTYIFIVLLPLLAATVLSNGIGGWMSIELGLFLLIIGRLHVDYAERRLKANDHAEARKVGCLAEPTRARA